MTNKNRTLTIEDLAALFGATSEEIIQFCSPLLEDANLNYRILKGMERDKCVVEAQNFLNLPNLPTAGESRHNDWEQGWGQNLKEFLDSGHEINALVPKYIKRGETVRLLGEFVQPTNPNFVEIYTELFRSWLFKKFFPHVTAIYEFGCGSASHIACLAQTFPDKEIYGLDWTEASFKIIKAMADHYDFNVHGVRFDFFNPDADIKLIEGAGVLTFGALEQVGSRHGPFIEYLIDNHPAVCVHVEGIEELYNCSYELDALALGYHQKRKYLSGFLTRLRELESIGKAEIISIHRQHFGNRFDDTYSYIVWRPTSF